jgi:hypothetical protein
MDGRKKIDAWHPIARDLAARLKGARYGEQKKIYAEVAKSTGLRAQYLRRLVMAADAIALVARFDRDTAAKLQNISVKASIALERWLSHSTPDAIFAARALVAGELSVSRLEQLEREGRARAAVSGHDTERPEEREWRFITTATDQLRKELVGRKLSWTSDSVTFLDDPEESMALPATLALLTAPPFFSQVWTSPDGARPFAVVMAHVDHPTETDRQRLETYIFALAGLTSFGLDGLLITNQKDHADGGRSIVEQAGLDHVVKVMHFEFHR